VGSIHAGDASNVIPSQVTMKGTIRTYQPSTRDVVLQRVRQVVEGVSSACGASAEFEVSVGSPAVINDPNVTQVVRQAAEAVLGSENISTGERTMGSEDASFFMQEIPGCYFFLGASNADKGFDFPHHNSCFDFDEQALALGVAILAQAASLYLMQGEG
jgi:amidohydrolase